MADNPCSAKFQTQDTRGLRRPLEFPPVFHEDEVMGAAVTGRESKRTLDASKTLLQREDDKTTDVVDAGFLVL